MLIHGVNLKRAVDGNMKPVSGNPLCECFTFAKISETRSLWRGSKSRFGEDPDGWIKWMAEDFMDKYAYSDYTNVVSVKPDRAGDVLETVRHRLESFIRSLVTDMNKGRSWGCSHYSVKNLHRTSGKRGRARAEDGGVSCENGPRGKAPEQTVMDFDQKPKEEKRRTFRKLPILGEPDTPCKSKEETIADIRHWQLENQKILHAEHEAIMKELGNIRTAMGLVRDMLGVLRDLYCKMDAKVNGIAKFVDSYDSMMQGWKPVVEKTK